MPSGSHPSPSWLRYTSLGLELAATIAVLTWVGSWVDRQYGFGPWGGLLGFFVGLCGGLFRFMRNAQAAMQQATEADRRKDS